MLAGLLYFDLALEVLKDANTVCATHLLSHRGQWYTSLVIPRPFTMPTCPMQPISVVPGSSVYGYI